MWYKYTILCLPNTKHRCSPNISASVVIISASAPSSGPSSSCSFGKRGIWCFQEDMATLSYTDPALQASTWLRANSWEFKELYRDLLNPQLHRLVNYVWGHVIMQFSSISVRERGLADFHANYNVPGHGWIQTQFAAADTTSVHASYRQCCQFLQWR